MYLKIKYYLLKTYQMHTAQTALTIDLIIESRCRGWLVTARDELKHEIKSPTVVTMWRHPSGSWRRYFIYSQIISISTSRKWMENVCINCHLKQIHFVYSFQLSRHIMDKSSHYSNQPGHYHKHWRRDNYQVCN